MDARTRVWADSVSRGYLSSFIAQKQITEAGIKAFAECFAREFTTRFRAKPAVSTYRAVYAETGEACMKQRSP